jgi:hypothetical protein
MTEETSLMGGLLKAPKPVIVQPAPAPDPAVGTAAAAPSTAAVQQGERARAAAQAATKDGMDGLIATSPAGLLQPLPAALAVNRKSLLGH